MIWIRSGSRPLGTIDLSLGSIAEGLFHNTILKAVKSNDGKASSNLQKGGSNLEKTTKFPQLVVHFHAEGLKNLGGGMGPASATNELLDSIRKLQGRFKRSFLPFLHNPRRNLSGKFFLSKVPKNLPQISFIPAIDKVGSSRPLIAHSHIERAIEAERKTPFTGVKLMGRNSKIEQDSIKFSPVSNFRETGNFAKATSHRLEPATKPGKPFGGVVACIGISINSFNRSARPQKRLGVTASSQGAVNNKAAFRRSQKMNHFLQKN